MIVVGLGNSGKEYEQTRHNAGFMALDFFAREHGFPEYKLSKKHTVLLAEKVFEKEKIVLVKPQTFMNNSGKAVKSILKNAPAQKLVVVHDDIDLPLGKVKVSETSGSAGHKGVESIIQELGTKSFTRVRIGIQPLEGKSVNVEEFVLQKFPPQELPLLQQSLTAASNFVLSLA